MAVSCGRPSHSRHRFGRPSKATRRQALRIASQISLTKPRAIDAGAGAPVLIVVEAPACDEDDCLSIAALRAVNNLPASYRAYEVFNGIIKPGFPRLRLSKRKEKPMKLTTIALALACTLPATFALAQTPMNLPGTEDRTAGDT